MNRTAGSRSLKLAALLTAGLLGLAYLPLYCWSLGTEEVRALVAESPQAEEYPQAGALILYQNHRMSIGRDHSQVLEEHLLVKILKDRSRGFGDQKRNFDAKTDSVEVVLARTWLPDLNTVEVEPKAINVITLPEVAGAAVYADIKQKVISFPSIAPGVVIELKVRTISSPDTTGLRLYPYWDIETFQSGEPILHKIYSLAIPEDFPEPKVLTAHGLEQPEISLAGGVRTMQWEIRSSPMIIAVPNMPPTRSFAPFMMFSNLGSWEELGRWLADRFYRSAAPDEAIRRKVAELTSGCATAADSVREIFFYVATQVRDIGLWIGWTGYKPHPAAEVFQNKYGEYMDKTVLLSAMLTAAGFANYPVLASGSSEDLFEPSVPSALQFDRMFVYLPGEFVDSTFTNPVYHQALRQGIWLAPFSQYNRYGYFPGGQGNRALVILPSGGTLFDVGAFPPEKNLTLSRAALNLSESGDLDGWYETRTDGYFDSRARGALKDKTPREMDQFFQEATNGIAEGAEEKSRSISDLKDLTREVDARLEFTAPEVGIRQGEMMIFYIPAPPFFFSWLPVSPDLEERDYDFVISQPVMLVSQGTVTLPRGWGAAYVPEKKSVESDFGQWSITCAREGDKLNYTRQFSLTKRVVSQKDYPEFKAFCDSYGLPKHSLVLLEKKALPARK